MSLYITRHWATMSDSFLKDNLFTKQARYGGSCL